MDAKHCKNLIIDGPFLAHRSYGGKFRLSTSTGLDSTLIYGFLQSYRAVKNKFNPDNIVIAWESKHPGCWRSDVYPKYKQNRPSTNPDYITYQTDLQLIMHLLGIKQYMSRNSEADDVIARLVDEFKGPTIIFANDKDMMQLVNEDVNVWTGKELFDKQKVIEKYGVEPYQIPDLLAIAGDSSDNIPGIANYGEKKAINLLTQYQVVENIPKDVMKDSLCKTELTFYKVLTTLRHDCMLVPLYEKDYKPTETLTSLLDKYELKKIQENLYSYKNTPSGSLEQWI